MKSLWAFLNKRLFKIRRPFRLTRGGWVFILYTIGVGAGAINTGNNLIYLIFGIFLGLFIGSGILSDLGLWKLEFKGAYPLEASAGYPVFVPIAIKNKKKWVPSLSVLVELEGTLNREPITIKKFIPVIFPQKEVSSHLVFFPLDRGLFRVRRVRMSTRFPFGLLYKWWNPLRVGEGSDRNFQEKEGLIVYPEQIHVDGLQIGFRSQGEEIALPVHWKSEGTVVSGIRDFRHADNPKRIHWRASAKKFQGLPHQLPTWVVRTMDQEEKPHPILVWPALSFLKELKPAEVENFVRFTAALLRKMKEEGKTVRFMVSSDEEGPEAKMYRLGNSLDQDVYTPSMEFLSLIDGRNPFDQKTMRYLHEETRWGHLRTEFLTFPVFDSFQSWMAQRQKEAA